MPLPRPSGTSSTSGKASAFADLLKESTETSSGDRAALPVNPNWKFFLHHWPSEWSVQTEGLKEPTWVPTLAKHVVRPGVNLNRTLKKTEPARAAYDQQILANVRAGATYLDLSDWRTFLPDGSTYRREAHARDPRTKREGTYFLEAFQTPRDKLPNKRLKFDFDRAGYNAWKLRLVHLGAIDPPPPSLIRGKIREMAGRLDRVRGMRGLEDSEKKRRIKGAEAELKKWTNAVVPGFDPAVLSAAKGGAA